MISNAFLPNDKMPVGGKRGKGFTLPPSGLFVMPRRKLKVRLSLQRPNSLKLMRQVSLVVAFDVITNERNSP